MVLLEKKKKFHPKIIIPQLLSFFFLTLFDKKVEKNLWDWDCEILHETKLQTNDEKKLKILKKTKILKKEFLIDTYSL